MVRGQSGTSVICEVDHDANLPVVNSFKILSILSHALFTRLASVQGFPVSMTSAPTKYTCEASLSSRSPSKYSTVA